MSGMLGSWFSSASETEEETKTDSKDERIAGLEEKVKGLKKQIGQLGGALARKNSELASAKKIIQILKERMAESSTPMGTEDGEGEGEPDSDTDTAESPELTDPIELLDQVKLLSMLEDEAKIEKMAREHGWDSTKERDSEGNPLFLVLIQQCASDTQSSEKDYLHARYMYTHRSDVKADETLFGDTALHICARQHWMSAMLQWLLKDGSIDPNSLSSAGLTPLHCAEFCVGNMEILLNDARIEINKTNDNNMTILMNIAQTGGNLDCFDLLVKHGADTTKRNRAGMNALNLAKQQLITIVNQHTHSERYLSPEGERLTQMIETLENMDTKEK